MCTTENLKIKVAVCPDCKGYKSATPVEGYDNNPSLLIQAKELKEELGNCLTLDLQEYENIQKSGNLSEHEISAYNFENEYWISSCGCTPICLEIKTFQDACRKLHISDNTPYFNGLSNRDAKQMLAFYKLTIITKALNEDWCPNPSTGVPDTEFDAVYYPHAFFNSSKGFPYKHDYVIIDMERNENGYNEREPGFLLVFKNDGLAKYAGTQFRDLYLDYYQYPETYLNRYVNK